MKNQINIHNIHYVYDKLLYKEQKYIQFINKICQYYKLEINQIDIIIFSDEELYKINYNFLQHDTYTDIITFPYHNLGEPIWADIYISYQRILENSSKYQVSFEQEWLRVLTHGILHLFGLNDKSIEEQKKMRETEDYWIENFSNCFT